MDLCTNDVDHFEALMDDAKTCFFSSKRAWSISFSFMNCKASSFLNLLPFHIMYFTASSPQSCLTWLLCILQLLVCKAALHGYQKVHRSPTPGKITKVGSEGKMPSIYEERDLPAKMLADDDSLFISCEGLVIHYKIVYERQSFGSVTHNYSQDAYGKDGCTTPGRPRFDNPSKVVSVCRNLSHSGTNASLHTPLISSLTEEVTIASNSIYNGHSCFPQQIPHLKLEDSQDELDSLTKLSKPGIVGSETGKQKTGLDGIILIHGFGGGVFSWRHVMTTLARHTGCAVAAFDRPGWGLTSRPRRAEWEEKRLPNPYELQSQVKNVMFKIYYYSLKFSNRCFYFSFSG
jgi:hypothetical protein